MTPKQQHVHGLGKMVSTGKQSVPHFKWRWLLAYLGISFGLLLFTTLALYFLYGHQYGDIAQVPRLPILITSFLVLFGGGFLTAAASPGRTVWEPAVGAAIVATALSIATYNLQGALFSWIMPFLFAYTGARFGEFVTAANRTKNLESGERN